MRGWFGLELRLLTLVNQLGAPSLLGAWFLVVVFTLLRVVRLGGHKIRKARSNVADAHDAADDKEYRDSSIALLLDMRCRFKAVMGVLDATIRYGVSLSNH